MELRPKSQLPLKRHYHRHTDTCTGYDWAVVEQIITAGTIDALPHDAHICDCDRAAVIKQLRYNLQAAREILKVNNLTLNRLTDLGQQLWPTSTH